MILCDESCLLLVTKHGYLNQRIQYVQNLWALNERKTAQVVKMQFFKIDSSHTCNICVASCVIINFLVSCITLEVSLSLYLVNWGFRWAKCLISHNDRSLCWLIHMLHKMEHKIHASPIGSVLIYFSLQSSFASLIYVI